MKLTIHTDGGARGNPGHAGIGIFIEGEGGQFPIRFKEYIGKKTNNEAEYEAVIQALTIVRDKQKLWGSIDKIDLYLDSLLVCNQLKGLYKVKQVHLQEIVLKIRMLEREIDIPITYTHVPRAQNAEADTLVNQALDEHLGLSQ